MVIEGREDGESDGQQRKETGSERRRDPKLIQRLRSFSEPERNKKKPFREENRGGGRRDAHTVRLLTFPSDIFLASLRSERGLKVIDLLLNAGCLLNECVFV